MGNQPWQWEIFRSHWLPKQCPKGRFHCKDMGRNICYKLIQNHANMGLISQASKAHCSLVDISYMSRLSFHCSFMFDPYLIKQLSLKQPFDSITPLSIPTYPLLNVYITMERSIISSMAIFHSYVKLPDGRSPSTHHLSWFNPMKNHHFPMVKPPSTSVW